VKLDWLLSRFATVPTHAAFVHQDRKVTYAQLLELISSFVDRLNHEGVRFGERVVVLGDYTPESFALMLALAQNSNIVIPLTRDSVVEVDAALAISGSDWLFVFEVDGRAFTISKHQIDSENELLKSFIATSAAGLILFSSGSTGRPKAILHDFERVTKKFLVQRDPVVAIPFLMFDHFGGFNTVFAITASLGTVVSVEDRSVKSICEAIEVHQVSLLPTTPSFLNLMTAFNAHRIYDLSSLRRITYGTEIMPQTTLTRLQGSFPNAKLQQTYGLSEVGVLGSKSRNDGSLWMRIGGNGFQTKIVDGILWVKSDFSMVGYLNADSGFDDDGWFNTQDRVEVEGEYFKILGRDSDLINVGGQKVYPAEIEDVIMKLSNVVDVAVSGESNAILGQIIIAKVVVKEPELVNDLKSRVRMACKKSLTAFKVPARVIIVEGQLYTSRQKKKRTANVQ